MKKCKHIRHRVEVSYSTNEDKEGTLIWDILVSAKCLDCGYYAQRGEDSTLLKNIEFALKIIKSTVDKKD